MWRKGNIGQDGYYMVSESFLCAFAYSCTPQRSVTRHRHCTSSCLHSATIVFWHHTTWPFPCSRTLSKNVCRMALDSLPLSRGHPGHACVHACGVMTPHPTSLWPCSPLRRPQFPALSKYMRGMSVVKHITPVSHPDRELGCNLTFFHSPLRSLSQTYVPDGNNPPLALTVQYSP